MRASLLLAALLGAAAVAADTGLSRRTMLQDYYAAFPWCKCDDLPRNDPIRLGYTGTGPEMGQTWVKFFIMVVDIPPTTSHCKDADLYKVEFRVAEDSRGCSTQAIVGDERRSATYEDLGSGKAILRVSELSITQAEIIAAGPEGIPLWVNMNPGCTVEEFFGPSFKYAMFNTAKDCCPVAIIRPEGPFPPPMQRSPPIPKRSPPLRPGSLSPMPPPPPPPPPPFPGGVPQAGFPPPPGGFPYCQCVTNPASSPWRVEVVRIASDGAGGEMVTLRLFADRTASSVQTSFYKLEINLASQSIVDNHRGSIRDVAIDGRSITSVYWQNSNPTVKWTMLGVEMEDAAGVIMTFHVRGTTLANLCGGRRCLYAAFNHNGNTGLCPVDYFMLP